MREFDVLTFPQRSPEWVAARLGRLTSSTADAMLATRKDGKPAAGRENLKMRLMLERITGKPQERAFQSPAMLHGAETEEAARAAYYALRGDWPEVTGFLSHKTLMVGASLDAHVGDFEHLIEIKCPIPATHWTYITTGKVPTDYRRQVVHQLWLTGAKSCDWMSFCPEFDSIGAAAKIVRIERDEKEIAEYDKAARAFLEEIDRDIEVAKTLTNLTGVLQEAVAHG